MKRKLFDTLILFFFSCLLGGKLLSSAIIEAVCNAQREAFLQVVADNRHILRFQDERGMTALHYACLEKKSDFIKDLIEFDYIFSTQHSSIPLIFIENDQKQTPLSLLLSTTLSYEFVRDCLDHFLLQAGFDINHRNCQGSTCLHDFVRTYKDSIVEENEYRILILLKNSGAQNTIRNNAGSLPFDVIKDTTTRAILNDLWTSKKKIFKSAEQGTYNSVNTCSLF